MECFRSGRAGTGIIDQFGTVNYSWIDAFDANGVEVTIEKVDGGLMAIPVPAGKHSIEFRYLPVGIRMCSYISAAAVIAFIILTVRSRKTNVLAMENKP